MIAKSDPAVPQISATLPESSAGRLVAGENGASLLRLVRVEADGREGPPVFGSYQHFGNQLIFTPDFRLAAGGRYRATLNLPGKPPACAEYVVPAPPAEEPPGVDAVFPLSNQLPANLLKFYVYFSTPMRQTDAIFDQIHILGANDEPVSDPWRRFPQWSDDGKRLTLWIHPGRVKRGVNLREEIGPVLEPGQKYRLLIDPTVEDLSGRAMGHPFCKAFTAGAEDHTRISLKDWKLELPKSGSHGPLTISFPKPLDVALLQRLVTIQDDRGASCAGEISVGIEERSWTFRPAFDWTNREYRICVDPLLEDLAGNTPVRVFDSEMGKDDGGAVQLSIPFRTR